MRTDERTSQVPMGKKHQQCFRKLIQESRKDILPNQPIYVIEDAIFQDLVLCLLRETESGQLNLLL